MSSRNRIGDKNSIGLSPAVGLEPKRVLVYSPLSVWAKKECRLSSRIGFGMKKYTFWFPADGLNKISVWSTLYLLTILNPIGELNDFNIFGA